MQDTVRVNRHRYIGGSDIPAIMNLSPFKSRFELLRLKAGLDVDTFEGNIYTEYGQTMEGKIRDYINTVCVGANYVEGKHYGDLIVDGVKQDIGIRCHTDGENDDTILEIKTTSNIFDDVNGYKGYLVQLLYYMLVAKKPNGVLAVYDRPNDMSEVFDENKLQIFSIKLDDYIPLAEQIKIDVDKFLRDRLRLIENPFLTEEDFLPKDVATIADKLLYLENELSKFKALEKEYEKQKESLLNAMQDANIKSWRTENGYIITAVAGTEDVTVTEKKLDEKLLAEKHPRTYKSCLVDVTTTKKGRKPYLKITVPKGDK